MNIIPYNKLKSGSHNVNLSYDGTSPINKAYYGDTLTLVRFSEYPRLKFDTESLSFATAGGVQDVEIISNTLWSASTSSSWITIATAATGITVTASENETGEDREGTVTVTAWNTDASISTDISVTQKVIQYIDYVQTDQYCWFDTEIIPDINTKIELVVTTMARTGNWKGFVGAQNNDDGNSTFQIRTYNYYNQFSARVGNGSGNVGPNYSLDTKYVLTLDRTSLMVNGTSYNTGTGSMDACNYSLYISAIHNPSWRGTGSISDSTYFRAICAKFHGLKVWKNDVLLGDFRPVLDENDIPCFYDEVTGTYKKNLGTGTPIAGPTIE